jgi:plastocyanin
VQRDVIILDWRYEPDTVTIQPGDTVLWTNLGAVPHTTTSEGQWDSGFLEPDDTFARTFDQVGRFRYTCRVHPDTMRGTVVVDDGSLPAEPERIFLPLGLAKEEL